ncbi:MAG: twin-arginine translocase TatA/TatE family subunit [Gemmatimonadota bacterium]
MGFGGLGMWEIILIFLVVLLLFGAKRLPEIGASLGKGIREFKGSLSEIEKEINTPQERDSISSGSSTGTARAEPAEKSEKAEKVESRRGGSSESAEDSEPSGEPRSLRTEG